jgi:hypothetical protein
MDMCTVVMCTVVMCTVVMCTVVMCTVVENSGGFATFKFAIHVSSSRRPICGDVECEKDDGLWPSRNGQVYRDFYIHNGILMALHTRILRMINISACRVLNKRNTYRSTSPCVKRSCNASLNITPHSSPKHHTTTHPSFFHSRRLSQARPGPYGTTVQSSHPNQGNPPKACACKPVWAFLASAEPSAVVHSR